ncbi:hypothetical protein C8R43DRAFT_954232 [Mycena crocata]|nr:hypothetical protein C8R43DRAFT_954232 [Mycena crocata]
MTSDQDLPLPDKITPAAREQLRRHAEAQSRYRERKLEETREKARQRMAKLRAQRTPEEAKQAADRRRGPDADYREYLRRKKFVKRFGHSEFLEAYFPLYELYGEKHFPGLRWTDKPEKKTKIQREVKSDADTKKKSRKAKKYANFVNVKEHDKNPRKHWYLVLNVGIFTKKLEGDAHCDSEDDMEIFFTRARAQRRWWAHCDTDHVHNGDKVVPDSEDDDDDDDAGGTRAATSRSPSSFARAASSSPKKKLPLFLDDVDVVPRPASIKREDVKREDVKREDAKREDVPLPLYMDDSPPPTPSRKRSVHAVATPAAAIESKRLRGQTSPARASPALSPPSPSPSSVLSPSVSSVSSLSTASSTTAAAHSGQEGASPTKVTAHGHPFRDLAGSISSASRGPRACAPPVGAAASLKLPTVRGSSAPPRDVSPSAGRRAAATVPLASNADALAPGRRGTASASASTSAARGGKIHFGPGAFGKFLAQQEGGALGSGSASVSGRGGASANVSNSAPIGGESVSVPRLLFNKSTQRIYIDVGTAVRDMATTETVQVVEYEDVVGYCAGKGGKLGQ